MNTIRSTRCINSMVILLFTLLTLTVAVVNGEGLLGEFAHESTSAIQFGSPKTVDQCSGVDTSVPSVSFFATTTISITSEEHEEDGSEHDESEMEGEEEHHHHVEYSLTPIPPSCVGVETEWTKMSGPTLTRRCGEEWITITAVEAKPDTEDEAEVKEGVVVTVQHADGSFCSTHLTIHEEEAAAATASWRTWVYSMIGVGISSVISLCGICILMFSRDLVKQYMKELLALSCGTFIGSVLFVLLPETGLELGMTPKITAVILGGILFGMISETLIHGGADYFSKRFGGGHGHSHGEIAPKRKIKKDDSSEDAKLSSVELTAPRLVAVKTAPSDVAASNHTAPETGDVVTIHCAAPCEDTVPDLECAVQQVDIPAVSKKEETQITIVSDASIEIEKDGGLDSPVANHHHHGHEGENENCLSETSKELDGHAHHHHHIRSRASDNASKHHDEDHSDGAGEQTLAEARHAAIINCVADALHNFIDGALIGATFLVNPATGWTTTAAVAIHELPQEIADFALLTNAGLSGCQAAMVNLFTSFTAFIGAIIAISIGEQFAFEVTNVLPFSAGLFLYLSLAVLMPDILKVTGKKVFSVWIAFAVGVGLMGVQLALPWQHSHGGGEEEGGHGHSHGRR